MRPRTIRYYIREAFRSLIFNRLMTAASIFAVASSLFIVSVFYIIGANVDHFMGILEDQLGIMVIVDDDQTPADHARLEGQITALPLVSQVTFRSRYEALEDIHDWFDNPDILIGLELDNPLRDSFLVELTDLAFQREVAQTIGAFSGVATVRTIGIFETIETLAWVIQVISAILILVLGIISVTIIINTIRITVNSRQSEINIMKYVGATDWFIRWPFIIEGLLIGLIGGAIPATIVWLGYGAVIDTIMSFPELAFIEFISPEDIYMYVFPFSLILASVIGLIGSAVSVRRHLKV